MQIRDGKEGRIQVRHLPPVSMNLQLPHGYPAAQAPRISLTAAWLSHAQLEGIAGELRRIAESCGGEGCSYSLVSWLQDEMLHHLGAQDCFCIPMDNALGTSLPCLPLRYPAPRHPCPSSGRDTTDQTSRHPLSSFALHLPPPLGGSHHAVALEHEMYFCISKLRKLQAFTLSLSESTTHTHTRSFATPVADVADLGWSPNPCSNDIRQPCQL